MREKDFTGANFGIWSIIKFEGRRENGVSLWSAISSCEHKETLIAPISRFRKVNLCTVCTKNIALNNKHLNRNEKYKNKKYGFLTITQILPIKNNLPVRCLSNCDCGTMDFESPLSNLKNGHTKSCGCYKNNKNMADNKEYNKYDLTGEYGIGYTNKNVEFYFDLEDYDKIIKYRWFENDQNYIIAKEYNPTKYIRLHRLVMGASDNEMIDHKNHLMKFDNRKQNLRFSDKQTNGINRGVNSNNKLGIKGVSYSEKDNKYYARIMINYKSIHIGGFNTLKEAEQARIDYEISHFGDFSVYRNAEAYKNE